MTHRSLVAAGASLLMATAAPAQHWRTFDMTRRFDAHRPATLQLVYATGHRLDVRVAEADDLAVQLRYDADRSRPVYESDSASGRIRVGTRERDTDARGGGSGGSGDSSEMRVRVPRAVPVDLDLSVGAADGALHLGGIDATRVHVAAGAGRFDVQFDAVNRVAMGELQIEVGAAEMHVHDIANANVANVLVRAGVGDVDLAFGGIWTRDIEAKVEVAVGGVTIHVPKDVGVRLEIGKVLTSVAVDGLTKRPDAYYSENFNRAAHRLRIRVNTVIGRIRLIRDATSG
jgi:hypothetical protein